MSELDRLGGFLAEAHVEDSVFDLRPDYRALLVAVEGLAPGPTGPATDGLVRKAEVAAREVLAEPTAAEVPHVAAWREAYQAFGAKPKRTRNSLEALLRRAEEGLPRVNWLTDTYNAVSVIHLVPLGGEDLARYAGPPRLVRATGTEAFDTVANGARVTEHPDPGEVVWCDDDGVTCRRWNWRQARRTQLREDTTSALFILDALDPDERPGADGGRRRAGDPTALPRAGPAGRHPPDHQENRMICCQFIFKPGVYDDDFHRLDGQIDQFARSLPGFEKVEDWRSPDGQVVNAVYYFADRESVAQTRPLPSTHGGEEPGSAVVRRLSHRGQRGHRELWRRAVAGMTAQTHGSLCRRLP